VKDGYDIVQCHSCGVFFRADLPDSDSLREIYGAAYFAASAGDTGGQGYADYLGEEANHRANAQARLRLLERHLAPGRLLDVGCAAGFFLDEARGAGWDGQGVEVSSGMVDHGKERLGLSVHDAPFADVELDAGTFDAVTMWDYIEHSADPAGDLRHASQLLRSGGVLALSTGDARSMIARLSGSRWHLLTPRHHNFFFTRPSLQHAFTNAGLKVELMTYASNLYSVFYLLYKLRTLWDSPRLERMAGRVGRTRFGERAIPINLRDIVTVVGRRL
jgi:2-polyprenyl-3-methyl-5-hydroxy-6-metoxy-1,4-benzoquinol methylase